MTLRVLEIFDSIQGEGFWTGTPMTFVRLAGCNATELGLACVGWCDTPESWSSEGGQELEVRDVISKVRKPRICLTGGEPLLQADGVSRLVAEARRLDVKVHLETNGTVSPPAPDPRSSGERFFDWAVVSPKPPDYVVADGWWGLVDELKFIADDQLTVSVVERVSSTYPEAVVVIQPVWGPRTTDRTVEMNRAVKMVMEHPEWRLSLQMHKFVGAR